MGITQPTSTPIKRIEQQLEQMIERMQQTLESEDWKALTALDIKLQHALPILNHHKNEPEVQNKLHVLNKLYTQILKKAVHHQASIQRQISQQLEHKQGLLAYIKNQ